MFEIRYVVQMYINSSMMSIHDQIELLKGYYAKVFKLKLTRITPLQMAQWWTTAGKKAKRGTYKTYDRRPHEYYWVFSLKSLARPQQGIPVRRGCHRSHIRYSRSSLKRYLCHKRAPIHTSVTLWSHDGSRYFKINSCTSLDYPEKKWERSKKLTWRSDDARLSMDSMWSWQLKQSSNTS